MSEPKRPFDAAIDAIRNWQRVIEPYADRHIEEIADLEEAVHVLLDWPKWRPLIKAAERVDKKMTFMALEDLPLAGFSAQNIIRNQLYSLLEALPDKAEDTFAYQSVFGSKPGKEGRDERT